MEYEKSEFQAATEAKYDQGYSEQEQALDIEIQTGDWKNLKKLKGYKKRTRLDKILMTYAAVSNRLALQLRKYVELVSANPRKAETVLLEIKKLQVIQDILVNCLIWESKGQLEREMIPSDVWELIE